MAEDESVDGLDPDKVREALETPPPNESTPSPIPPKADTSELTYEERAALRRAQRENRKTQENTGGDLYVLTVLKV